MADTEHEELPVAQTTHAGSLHTLYHELLCQPGPPASFEGCIGNEAGMDRSSMRLKRFLGGKFCIMCPVLDLGQALCQVDTAKELLVLEWPEARAAAQRGKTGASTARSASSSGPGVTLTQICTHTPATLGFFLSFLKLLSSHRDELPTVSSAQKPLLSLLANTYSSSRV